MSLIAVVFAVNVSYMPNLQTCYERNKEMLLRQVEILSPNIVIGGYTLPLFFNGFGLSRSDFARVSKTVSVCHKNGRLYVDAYHP